MELFSKKALLQGHRHAKINKLKWIYIYIDLEESWDKRGVKNVENLVIITPSEAKQQSRFSRALFLSGT